MKKLLVLVVLSLMMVGCGSVEVPEKTEPSAQEVKQELYKVGDTVKLGDLELTVNSTRFEKGDGFWEPKEGHKWLVFNVSVKNVGEKPIIVTSLGMFKVYDDQNYSCDITFFTTGKVKKPVDGELAPGRIMRGELCYEVPLESKSFEFVFEPSMFNMGQAIFKVGE